MPAPDLPLDDLTRVEKLGRRLMIAGLVCVGLLAAFAIYQIVRPVQWDPALEPYVEFVEAERQLEFIRTVDVRWADIAADLEAGLAEDADSDFAVDEPDPWSDAYRLLGLIDPDVELTTDQSQTEALVENAGAFYEPWTETIVLPEGQTETALSVTIVHELTHALQHQHGMLGGALFDSADGATMRTALVEGDAERVAIAYFWSLTEEEQTAFLDAAGYDPDQAIEDPGNAFYEASFYSSYEIGLPLVESIVESDGVDGLNSLLRAKDVGTTERLVDPLSSYGWSRLDANEEMALPVGATETVGDLGAITWFQALAPEVGVARAYDALLGYDDDAFAVFTLGGQTCARFTLTFDTPNDAAEFVEIVGTQEVEAIDATGQTTQVDLCEPIGDASEQRLATVLPLVVGAEAASFHLRNGESEDVARCAGLAQAATIGIDDGALAGLDWDETVSESAQFLDACR